MDIHLRDAAGGRVRPAARPGDAGAAAGGPGTGEAAAGAAVTALYQAHAPRLIGLAYLMLGDRGNAEDVVQEAFCGLYRRWYRLSDPGNAQRYLHSSVMNGCRSALRRTRTRRTTPNAEPPVGAAQPPVLSAEAAVLTGEERQQVLAAVRQLPPRQREALVLRFYLELPEEEIAAAMGIGQSTVRSATHRALASLARMLREES